MRKKVSQFMTHHLSLIDDPTNFLNLRNLRKERNCVQSRKLYYCFPKFQKVKELLQVAINCIRAFCIKWKKKKWWMICILKQNNKLVSWRKSLTIIQISTRKLETNHFISPFPEFVNLYNLKLIWVSIFEKIKLNVKNIIIR